MASKKTNSGTSKNKQAVTTSKPWHECGEIATYGEMCDEKRAKGRFERDHVPSHGAMKRKAFSSKSMDGVSEAVKTCVANKLKSSALAIAIPKGLHKQFSRTWRGRNTAKRIKSDAKNLKSAANKDLRKLQAALDKAKHPCAEAYREAAKQIRQQDHNKLVRDAIKGCKGG